MEKLEKAYLEFEGKTYLVDLENNIIRVKENGTFRPVLKTEIDLFDLLERGKKIKNVE